MSKRTLYFGNPAKLRLKDSQIQINLYEPEIKTVTVPVEEISLIILDHQRITISHGLIQKLQEYNVAIMSCDKRHFPQGLFLPIEGNSILHERHREQLNVKVSLKKQLWRQTVICKIKNQALHLEDRDVDSRYLTPLYQNVRSGDNTNCEATAAAFYWKKLIPEFKRSREGLPPNNYFNYGYSILRAIVSRSIVMAGLLPTLGIHHSNRYNAFCLADDLMEPYRPIVDGLICKTIDLKGVCDDLPHEIKAELLRIPVLPVRINNETIDLVSATNHTVVSLVKCFTGEQKKILYPEMNVDNRSLRFTI